MTRKDFNTPEYKKKKILRRGVKYSLTILFIGAFVYAMNRPYFFFEKVLIQGQQTLPSELLDREVETYLSGYWLGIISRRNIFFMGASSLSSVLTKKYPKIYNVDIDTEVNILRLTIEERKAHSLWCIDREYESIFNEECYFADQRGFWYARAPYFSDNVFVKVYLSPEISHIALGERYMNTDSFTSLFEFVNLLEEKQEIKIQKIVFKDQQDIDLYIYQLKNIIFKNKPIIFLNMEDSYQKTLRNISVVLQQPEFLRDLSLIPQQLKHIDVRFDDRVFYLFDRV